MRGILRQGVLFSYRIFEVLLTARHGRADLCLRELTWPWSCQERWWGTMDRFLPRNSTPIVIERSDGYSKALAIEKKRSFRVLDKAVTRTRAYRGGLHLFDAPTSPFCRRIEHPPSLSWHDFHVRPHPPGDFTQLVLVAIGAVWPPRLEEELFYSWKTRFSTQIPWAFIYDGKQGKYSHSRVFFMDILEIFGGNNIFNKFDATLLQRGPESRQPHTSTLHCLLHVRWRTWEPRVQLS